MKRSLVIAGVMLMLVGGAQAREVAFCGAGFNIAVVPGDKAVCQKTERVREDIGPRHCAPGMNYAGNEANDNGDLCNLAGGVLGAPPAILCEIDPAYAGRGAKTDMVANGRDRCYVMKSRTVDGNISTRQE
jgi:hypothetical protein